MKIKSVEITKFKGLDHITVSDCGAVNAFIGKNNSGKSSILHAIDMAGLALSVNHWGQFQPKLEIKDLISETGQFEVTVTFEDDSIVQVKSTDEHGPQINPVARDDQKYKSVLILPDTGAGLVNRRHQTPHHVIAHLNDRRYGETNALEILYAIKYYSERSERGMTPATYRSLIEEIIHYFPDLEDVESDRTEFDISTLPYKEYGKKLDILYSGTGLKHFLDVLLKVTISEATIVLLDEPEMGLHPDLQRRFMDYLQKLAKDKGIQFFLATQSQVLLNYADSMNFYRVTNVAGQREANLVPTETIHTLIGDLGLRPSDVFNQDICLLVEGASEVVLFEHLIRTIYKDDFDKIAFGIQQYGGGAAEAIHNGSISVSNITPAQKYVLWTHDRDAPPGDKPSLSAGKFKRRIELDGFECHIWRRREIEYYYPASVITAAQQGDAAKAGRALAILKGNQVVKFRTIAEAQNVTVPSGTYLRRLLKTYMTKKSHVPHELKTIIEQTLIPWSREILG